jgi:hypothetical protein
MDAKNAAKKGEAMPPRRVVGAGFSRPCIRSPQKEEWAG